MRRPARASLRADGRGSLHRLPAPRRPVTARGLPASAAATASSTMRRSAQPTTRWPQTAQTVLTFGQAQDQARAFFDRKRRELAGHIEGRSGPLTVAVAVEVYLAHRRRRGSKGCRRPTSSKADARIVPALGAVEVEQASPSSRIDAWLHESGGRAPPPAHGPVGDGSGHARLRPQRRRRGPPPSINRQPGPDHPQGRAQPRLPARATLRATMRGER